MQIRNVHSRVFTASAADAGALLDGLAGADDRLWPSPPWPPMRFDRALAVGARGGHGPIRYRVEAYEPGRHLRFRFEGSFDGYHEFCVEPQNATTTALTHRIEMTASGGALLRWLLIIRPLHDALVEDALDRAARALGGKPAAPPWSWWVRGARALMARQRRGQATA